MEYEAQHLNFLHQDQRLMGPTEIRRGIETDIRI